MMKTTKKAFVDPKMTKCEQPLDKVTMGLGCYRPSDDWRKQKTFGDT